MKMMVRDEYQGTVSAFTKNDKANFYLTGLPPIGMWIGLAWCGDPIWAGAFHRQHKSTSYDEDTLNHRASYTMGLGATIVFVEFPVGGQTPEDVPADQVLTIWPSSGGFEWPARRRLNRFEVRAICMRFAPFLESAGDQFGRSQQQLWARADGNRKQRRAKKGN